MRITPMDGKPIDLFVDWTIRPVSAMAQIEVQQPQLEMSVFGPKDIAYGETAKYTIRLSNPGNGDAEDVVVASTNASLFAYVADGRNGLKVLQLTSPDSQRAFYGFSPEPKPELIAWAKTPSPALAVSKGLDRDRAVDETGGQIAIFGRLGSRPFTRSEMEGLFLSRKGFPYKVSDEVDMSAWKPAR